MFDFHFRMHKQNHNVKILLSRISFLLNYKLNVDQNMNSVQNGFHFSLLGASAMAEL